jgi:hypothetical protein
LLRHLNVVCYKWGKRYSAEDVNILRASVARHLKISHRFFCVTEDGAGLAPDIEIRPLPQNAMIGNGPKISTFSEGFLGLSPDDYVVSLDVDIVIVDALDFLAQAPEKTFIIAKHRSRRSISRGHGAVYRVKVGSHRKIWDDFVVDPHGWAAKYPGMKSGNKFSEQRWLEHQFAGRDMEFFEPNKVLIFREDCSARAATAFLGWKLGQAGVTTAFLRDACLPNIGESIVSFSGATKPKDVMHHHHGHLRRAPFVAEHWHL